MIKERNLDDEQMARLYVLIVELNSFLHRDRDFNEFKEFQKKIYSLVKYICYNDLEKTLTRDVIDSLADIQEDEIEKYVMMVHEVIKAENTR